MPRTNFKADQKKIERNIVELLDYQLPDYTYSIEWGTGKNDSFVTVSVLNGKEYINTITHIIKYYIPIHIIAPIEKIKEIHEYRFNKLKEDLLLEAIPPNILVRSCTKFNTALELIQHIYDYVQTIDREPKELLEIYWQDNPPIHLQTKVSEQVTLTKKEIKKVTSREQVTLTKKEIKEIKEKNNYKIKPLSDHTKNILLAYDDFFNITPGGLVQRLRNMGIKAGDYSIGVFQEKTAKEQGKKILIKKKHKNISLNEKQKELLLSYDDFLEKGPDTLYQRLLKKGYKYISRKQIAKLQNEQAINWINNPPKSFIKKQLLQEKQKELLLSYDDFLETSIHALRLRVIRNGLEPISATLIKKLKKEQKEKQTNDK